MKIHEITAPAHSLPAPKVGPAKRRAVATTAPLKPIKPIKPIQPIGAPPRKLRS